MPRKLALLSRRRALVAGGAACAAAAMALAAWHLLADRGAALRAMIAAHLRDMPVADGVIDAFVSDFLARHPVSAQGVAISSVCDGLGTGEWARCVNNADYLRRIEVRAIDLFLRSTDFFEPNRRAGDVIRYVAFWDPYSDSCRNPFADLSPPDKPNAVGMR
jgi:hypothetical protein